MQKLSDESRTSLERMCVTYQEGTTDATLSYLHGRGLTDQAIDYFRLGTVTPGGEHGIYKGRLSIPYLTTLGGVVGFKFRAPHDCTEDCQHQKYITPYPVRLFNTRALDRAERLGYVAICEGEFDAMVLDQLCGIPAVGIPGVESWEKGKCWPLLFQGYSRVLFFKDNDEDKVKPDGEKFNPGRNLAKRVLSDVPGAELVDTEGLGKDINEIFLSFGADAIRELAEV